jgi:hypothetical protein
MVTTCKPRRASATSAVAAAISPGVADRTTGERVRIDSLADLGGLLREYE